MDTELSELKETMARVDERTQTILMHQEKHADALEGHEERDRQDFKEVHHRINRLERRQNWFLGGIAAISVCVGIAVKYLFGG